jgi:replicative DNA helicase
MSLDYRSALEKIQSRDFSIENLGIIITYCVLDNRQQSTDIYNRRHAKAFANREHNRIFRAMTLLSDRRRNLPDEEQLRAYQLKIPKIVVDTKPIFTVNFVYDAARYILCNTESSTDLTEFMGETLITGIGRSTPATSSKRDSARKEYDTIRRVFRREIDEHFQVKLQEPWFP